MHLPLGRRGVTFLDDYIQRDGPQVFEDTILSCKTAKWLLWPIKKIYEHLRRMEKGILKEKGKVGESFFPLSFDREN